MSLAHWNIAVSFTGLQAAALACGIDPANAELLPGKSLPLLERMESCYNSKKAWLWDDMGPHHEEGIIAKLDMLESVSLRGWESEVEPGTWGSYCAWVKAEIESRFEQQRFTRQELARWLAEIKFDSEYEFSSDPSDAVEAIAINVGIGTIKKWTPERRQELAKYRAEHGTKEAATKFNISESRLRQLLPGKKRAVESFSGFPQTKYRAQ